MTQEKNTLKDYLNEMSRCKDIRKLFDEFNIMDNYRMGFYGNQEEILKILRQELNSSPNDILKHKYTLMFEHEHPDRKTFGYRAIDDAVLVNVHVPNEKITDPKSYWFNDIMEEGDALTIILHLGGFGEEKIEFDNEQIPMSMVIKDIGNLVLKRNLTAEFQRPARIKYGYKRAYHIREK